MQKERIEVARNVARQINLTERKIDKALADSADLIKSIVEGRVKAKLPVSAGSDALLKIGRSVQMMTEVRGLMVEAHAHLADDQRDLNIPVTASGDLWECPPSGKIVEPVEVDGDNVHKLHA